MKYLTTPTNEWGPALVKHRREAKRFIDKWDTSFEVDPLGKEALENVSPNDINVEVRIVISPFPNVMCGENIVFNAFINGKSSNSLIKTSIRYYSFIHLQFLIVPRTRFYFCFEIWQRTRS